ncbi:hypothetical protein AN643_03790 [Candidatus Epulonipiscioides saccharophilum]|nr:hypothetical protein AN643_03790 [Epulopiscium sp. SCG-B10WGA-EpuloB]
MDQIKAVMMITYKEKTRRFGFLAVIFIAIFLAYLCMSKESSTTDFLSVSSHIFKQADTIEWVPMTSAFALAVFFPLIGFFYFKTDLVTEHKSGKAQLISITKTSNYQYLLGKYCAHFIILFQTIIVTMCATFVSMKWLFPDDTISIYNFVSPFLTVIFGILLLAGLPVIFDAISFLRGVIGSLVYVTYYCMVVNEIFNEDTSIVKYFDITGLSNILQEIQSAVFKQSDGQIEVSLRILSFKEGGSLPLYFDGIHFNSFDIIFTISLIIIAFIMLFIVSNLVGTNFKNFKIGRQNVPIEEPASLIANTSLLDFNTITRNLRFTTLLMTEIKYNLKASPIWWIGLMLFITIFAYIYPYAQTSITVFIVLFVQYLASSSCREALYSTEDLINSSPIGRAKFLVIKWLSHFIVITICSSGVIIRTLLSGYFIGIYGYLAGIIFIISLALFLGEYTKRETFLQCYMPIVLYLIINGYFPVAYLIMDPRFENITQSTKYLLAGILFFILMLFKDKILKIIRDKFILKIKF